MKIIRSFVLVASIVAPSIAFADLWNGSIEVNYWIPDYEGVMTIGDDDIDLQTNAGYSDSRFFDVTVNLEHPIPFVPHLKARYSDIKETASGRYFGTFDGRVFSADNNSVLDITNADAIGYYEIFDNWFELDLGFAAKVFDGVFDIQDDTETDNFSVTVIDEVVPMLYIAANFNFPSSTIVFGTDILITSIDDVQMHDYKVRLKQGWGELFYGEAGFREIRLDVEDIDGLDVDTTVGGYYIGLGVDF